MGLAGEMASGVGLKRGIASFRTALIDALSRMDSRKLKSGMKLDVLQ
jgi:hydroxyethylthiazole kinase-like sugar kinase family protein